MLKMMVISKEIFLLNILVFFNFFFDGEGMITNMIKLELWSMCIYINIYQSINNTISAYAWLEFGTKSHS